jgi:L-ascorbate metabolism protein UlaG (beta-lactamase superfamily)
MKVHKFGHACLLVETEGARVLIDPGGFSSGFEHVQDLSAILITHAHGDHLNMDKIDAIRAVNPRVRLVADQDSARLLHDRGLDVTHAEEGQVLDVGVSVEAIGSNHAVIHPDLPGLINHGYLIGGRLFHPGDALTIPGQPVDVLALPIGAPWLKSSEFIDYLRALRPRTAIPIHDAVLAKPQIAHGLVGQLGPDGTEYVIVDDGASVDLGS